MKALLVSSFISAFLMTASSSSSPPPSPTLLEMELAELMAEAEAAKAFAGDDRLGISTDVTETYFLVRKITSLHCSCVHVSIEFPFQLFTLATGADSPVEVPKDLSSAQAETALEGAGFDPDKKTFFLIHGFWSGESFADEFVGGGILFSPFSGLCCWNRKDFFCCFYFCKCCCCCYCYLHL